MAPRVHWCENPDCQTELAPGCKGHDYSWTTDQPGVHDVAWWFKTQDTRLQRHRVGDRWLCPTCAQLARASTPTRRARKRA